MKTFWTILITVIIAGAIASVITWYLVRSDSETAPTEETTESTPISSESTLPANAIKDVTTLKVGDKVGDWTISKISRFTDTMDSTNLTDDQKLFSNQNAIIDFTGNVELSGAYLYGELGESSLERTLLFEYSKSSELAKMPYIPSIDVNKKHVVQGPGYIFANQENFAKLLGINLDDNDHSGSVDIKLSKYSLMSYPTGGIGLNGVISSVSNIAKTK